MREAVNRPCVIVTGSSGRIGRGIVRRLAMRYHVAALDQTGATEPLPPGAEFVQADIGSDPSINAAIERIGHACTQGIASIVHLAAYYDFSGEPSDLYERVNVRGTERLLIALRPYRPQQFLFGSTMLVHAPTIPGRPINESSPLAGRWAYPQSKIEAEQCVLAEHNDTPALLLRLAGVYTDLCDSIPLAQQIRRIAEEQLIAHVFPGDITHGQAYVHLDDVADAIELAVELRHKLPREVAPMLIGEPRTYSYDEVQRELGRLLQGERNWITAPIPRIVAKSGAWIQEQAPGVASPFIKPWMIDMADDHYELDITRAREWLGWSPRHRLIDSLQRMVESMRADPLAWYRRHNLPIPRHLREPEQRRA